VLNQPFFAAGNVATLALLCLAVPVLHGSLLDSKVKRRRLRLALRTPVGEKEEYVGWYAAHDWYAEGHSIVGANRCRVARRDVLGDTIRS